MASAKDLAGKVVGRLTIIDRAGSRGRHALWTCVCECGSLIQATTKSITAGKKSCGCLASEAWERSRKKRQLKHGDCRGAGNFTPEYRIWRAMKARCFNPNVKAWPDYGGRGITVCKRWLIYSNFLADVGRRPTPEHSIDRYPNNDGNYEPGNVRWATKAEQAKNRRPRRR